VNNQGWVCPVCGTVYSPHVTKCERCRPKPCFIRPDPSTPTPAEPPFKWPNSPWRTLPDVVMQDPVMPTQCECSKDKDEK
jgi:hypothetical protein